MIEIYACFPNKEEIAIAVLYGKGGNPKRVRQTSAHGDGYWPQPDGGLGGDG